MKRNARIERRDLEVGDTFIAPTGPFARFPEREMRVIAVTTDRFDRRWVNAEPVRPLPTDRYWHSTYRIESDGYPMPIHILDDDLLAVLTPEGADAA